MSGEFLQLLQVCGSPQQQQRKAAEARLAEAERQDAAQFMLLCAEAFRDRRGQVEQRQRAGLLLKNGVCAGEPGPKARQLARRWHGFGPAVKAQIRAAALETLLDPGEARVRRIAALCCARIGAVDVPAGAWPEAVPTLAALTGSSEVPPEASEEAMRALGFLAEEWQAHLVPEANVHGLAEQALAVALRCLGAASLGMQIASAKAVHAMLPFASLPQLQQEDAGEARALLGAVLAHCGPSAQEDLRKEALQCLACAVVKCYRHLDAALKSMAESCLGAIASAPEPVVVQAIEVWTTLAEHELQLSRGPGPGGCKKLTQEALPWVLPALFECLVRSGELDDEGEDDGLMTSGAIGAARTCAMATSRLLADACVVPALGFVESGLASPNRFQRRAAILTFGAILEGPSAQTLSPIVGAALPRLLESLKGELPTEAAAAAWALGRALEWHPMAVPDACQASLFELCIARFGQRAWLTEELCYCLDGLLDQQAATLPAGLFCTVAQALLQSSANAAERSCAVLLRSLTELVARADEECVAHMASVLQCLLGRAEAEVQRGREPPAPVVDCLRALTLRVGAEGALPYAERLLSTYLRAAELSFQRHGGFEQEVLLAAGTLAAVLGRQFEAGLRLLWPTLAASVCHVDDREGCLAGLSALHEVVKALGQSFGPYGAEALRALEDLFGRREDLELRQRASALACLGELGLQLGRSTPGLPRLLELVSQEVAAVLAKTRSSIPELVSRSPSQAVVVGDTLGKEGVEWKVLDAALGAYESVVRGCRQSGPLPPEVRPALPLALGLACLYGKAPWAATSARRLAVHLLGAMVAEAPADMVAFVGANAETASCIQELASFGACCPNKKVRESAAVVAGLPLAVPGVAA